ncbi:MarR family [Acididesulfobacillus acetoxydans]|uniref:MarR family n=1 Tax=Acididesulfobacillus acetoxydans TaxID=1561005 RepID=A0A8S0X567_9FIRM|nr:ROK family transcriptional regulator [Acididesulfobacillus acetoxydans]CAA7601400.1 MarR family [Acididesulfobacillus acetoxydans]CEJ08831.1 Xylose repressor [Acididesulfobacillus acetoxydans]
MALGTPVGSFQWMKLQNKSNILNTIRLQGPVSRAEIASLTGLTPPTVTNIVAELLEAGLVIESELGESTGGRKPIMLRLNAEGFYVLGVYAGVSKVKAVSAGLDGTIRQRAVLPLPKEPSAENFLSLVKETLRQVIEKTEAKREKYLGIGVGMHGLVDTERGLSIFAPNLKLRNIPLKAELEAEFNLTVEVENDVRALALGESWFGQGQGLANFICINVATGLGAGIVLDHKLYEGSTFTAGEIGHTTIDIDGPQCTCGNHGCLEAMAAGPAIAERARKRIQQGDSSLLKAWTDGHLEGVTAKMVHEAAKEGDELAIGVLADTGRYLGIGIANLLNTLNPSRIILTGGVAQAGDFVLQPLKETVARRALETPARAVSIVTSEMGEDADAVGAFTLVLRRIFTPMGVNEL